MFDKLKEHIANDQDLLDHLDLKISFEIETWGRVDGSFLSRSAQPLRVSVRRIQVTGVAVSLGRNSTSIRWSFRSSTSVMKSSDNSAPSSINWQTVASPMALF